MSLLKVKGTVRPRSLVIAAAVINAANAVGLREDMLITSGNDGAHVAGSRHYTGQALDVRTKHLTAAARSALIAGIRARLGHAYQVLLEELGRPNEHLHIEWDPA